MDEERLDDLEETADEVSEDTDVVDIDTDESEEVATDDGNDDFEYDEDGNIIIPEPVEDSEEEESEEEEQEAEHSAEQKSEDTKVQEQTTTDAEAEKTKRELEDLQALVLAVAGKLGAKNKDAIKALAEIGAECDGISSEEFLKAREEEQRRVRAEAQLRISEFEKLAAADLVELHTAFPETKTYGHIRELPDGIRQRYAQFRDKGLSAKEAYAAANPDGIRATVAETVKKQSNRGKDHLRSSVPKGSRDTTVSIPRKALEEWRDLFPNLSDKEIASLYRKTADKEK